VIRDNGSVERFPGGIRGRRRIALGPRDGLVVRTSGGGGYGDARQRDRWRVAKDLREGRISRESAVRDYGLSREDVERLAAGDGADRH